MDEKQKKAYDFASETSKQIITLSTAIITVTITFLKDIVKTIPTEDIFLLKWAWLAFLLAVLGGIWTLMGLTGSLVSTSMDQIGSNIRIPASLQVLAFLIGLALTILFGVRAF
jgi:hypothetical protein